MYAQSLEHGYYMTGQADVSKPPRQHGATVPDAAQSGKLRIVIGADTFSPDVNGAAKFAERLAAGLAERGHDVHIVAPASSGRTWGTWKETYGGQQVTAHRLRSWRWYPHDWLRFALPWRIRQNSARILDSVRPDVVHFQSHIIVGRGLSVEAEKRGIRTIGTNHFMPENMLEFTLLPKAIQEWAVGLAWKAASRSFGRAEAVTTPTRNAANFLEKHTDLKDVYAISCGIDAQRYKPIFTPRSDNNLLFVGRVTGEKQIDVLIRAMALLPEDLDAKLEIVGGGDQKKNLESLTKSLKLSNRVTFLGYLSDDELMEAYSRAALFVMPSVAELQSIATMEAMASGLPVVAANAMALPHLVHEGENGFLFTPGDAHELASKIEQLLRMPDEQFQRFKKRSLALLEPHDIQRTISTFESLYRGEKVTDTVIDVNQEPPSSGNMGR